MIDEEVQHGLPEYLILKHLAEASGDDGPSQLLTAAEATHLRPADRLNSRQVMRCLREPVCHCLGQPQWEVYGADVLTPAQMLVPLLLGQLLAVCLIEPNGSHERRDGITSKQVLSKRRE